MVAVSACGPKADSGESGQSAANEQGENQGEESFNISYQNANEYGVYLYQDIKLDESRKSTATTGERCPLVQNGSEGPSELQPYNTNVAGKENFIYACYESLIYRVGPDEYEGRLAKEWKWEDDTHLLVTLYDYIHDWEGNPITASDVVFSYKLAVDSGYASGFDAYYYDGCEAVDDYTVRFNFSQKPTALTAFDDIFGKLVCVVSEKAYGEHNFAVDPVGTGPYKLKEFITDSKFVLEADDNYWQKEELRSKYAKANVQEVVYNDMEESFQQVNGLMDGSLINVTELEDEELPNYLPGGKYYDQYNLMISPGANVHAVIPNCSGKSRMSDINFRMAVWYAIDNESVAEALSIRYSPATVISNPGVQDFNEEWYGWKNYMSDYDPELAKEYLAKTDYKGEEIVIVLEKDFKTVAQCIQGYLSMIGINAKINVVDKALVTEEVEDPTKWDIYICKSRNQKPAVCKLQDFVDVNYGPMKGKALSFVEDPVLQEKINVAANIDTYSAEATDDVMQYIIDNGYLYCAAYPLSIHVYSKKVAEYTWRYGTSKPILGACEYYLDE